MTFNYGKTIKPCVTRRPKYSIIVEAITTVHKQQQREGTTTQQEIREFLAYLQAKDDSPATVRNYNADLKKFMRWYRETTGEEPVPDTIGSLDIVEFRNYLVRQGQKATTINRALATLATFFSWAGEQGYAHTNPARDVRKIKEVKPAPRALQRKDLLRLLRAVRAGGKTRDCAMVILLVHTGLRVAELCNLRAEDVTIAERSGELRVRYGKGGKERAVPLNATARRALNAWLQERGVGPGPLFTKEKGNPAEGISTRQIEYLIRKYALQAGLELTPHTLRHTFCKNLIDAGESLDRVAALAGHASLNTTARYTQPTKADLQRSVERIDWE